MVDKKTTAEVTRSPIDGTELVRLATSSDNWKTTIDAALNANWQTSRSSFSGTELVRVTGASSLNWKAPVSDILNANWETTRSSLSGTEFVRITGDSSNNWKTTIDSVIGANWQTTLNPIAGTETVRLTDTSSQNWKATVSKVLDAPHPVSNLTSTTFALLPPAAQASGAIVRISDSTETHLGRTVAGGGANSVEVQSDGTVWRVFGAGGRRVACGNVTFYISPTGNDTTGDGTIGNPYQTLNRAWGEVVGIGTGAGIDCNGFQLTFQLTDGSHDYTTQTAIDISQEWVGGSDFYIRGNGANPEAVVIRYTGVAPDTAVCFSVNAQRTGKLVLQYLTCDNWHVNVWGGWYDSGTIWVDSFVHRNGPNANHIEIASMDTHCAIFGTDKISTLGIHGTQANSHLYIRQGGRAHYYATTLNIDNATQTFNIAYARLQDPGSALIYEPPARTGTYLGARWKLDSDSVLDIWGNANWTPPDPKTAIYSNDDPLTPDLVDGGAKLLFAVTSGLYDYIQGKIGIQQVDLVGTWSNGWAYTALHGFNESSNNRIVTYDLYFPRIQGLPGASFENDGSGNLSWVNGRAVSTAANKNFYVSKLSGAIVPGSSYTDGTYTNVSLTGGSGSGALANIVVSGGQVTSVRPSTMGTGYATSDVLSAASSTIGSSGSGFTFTLQAIGSTLNSGLSSGSPVPTLVQGLTLVDGYSYSFAGLPNIFMSNGIYDEGDKVNLPVVVDVGPGVASIRGNTPSPDSVEIRCASDVLTLASDSGWTFWGMKLTSTGTGGGVIANRDSYAEFYDMHFDTRDDCIINFGQIYHERPTVTAGRAQGLYRGSGANCQGVIGAPITITASVWHVSSLGSVPRGFINLQQNARGFFPPSSGDYVGSSVVTGIKYNITTGSLYAGIEPENLPGTENGTIDGDCQINGAFRNLVQKLSSATTPSTFGYFVIEGTSDTLLTLRYYGSDSVIRSATITLSSS